SLTLPGGPQDRRCGPISGRSGVAGAGCQAAAPSSVAEAVAGADGAVSPPGVGALKPSTAAARVKRVPSNTGPAKPPGRPGGAGGGAGGGVGEQSVGAPGGHRREDRQTQRRPELLGGVEQ